MKMQDLDTMTNVILNNEYKLHEDKENENISTNEVVYNRRKARIKKKSKKKKKVILIFKVFIVLMLLGITFLVLFFKTSLFQKYKELW